jgi:hypothetical protein
MRICLSTVDLPLSPAPVRCSQQTWARGGKGGRTEQQQLDLSLLLLPVIADALLDLLIATALVADWFLAETH